MGRPVSSDLQSIFAASNRKIDWTLDISFPDATSFHFATRPLSIDAVSYTNDLESVGDLSLSIEAPIDTVSFKLQNVDRVLGLHIAEHWRKWQRAEIVAGRLYRGGAGYSLSEWVAMFKGAVQRPNADDLHVTFDAIPDTVSPGPIVAPRTLHPNCFYVYKDATTCGYDGDEPACNHLLRSEGGCIGKVTGSPGTVGNVDRFGGMDHFYTPDPPTPGSVNNPGILPGGGYPCPRLDQFVLVKGEDGKPTSLMVCFLTTDHELFNPTTRTFHRVEWCYVAHNQPIHELIASRGAVGYSSAKHPVLWYKEHATGEPVERFSTGDPVLCWQERKLVNTKCLLQRDTAENGDVMKIHMVDGHIYCYGDSPEKFIVCHNLKGTIDDTLRDPFSGGIVY